MVKQAYVRMQLNRCLRQPELLFLADVFLASLALLLMLLLCYAASSTVHSATPVCAVVLCGAVLCTWHQQHVLQSNTTDSSLQS